jgi:SulP family sulfate permease
VVVLRLRGRTRFGATLIDVLARYADKLNAARGRLYLSGIGVDERDRVVSSGQLHLAGPVRVYEATPVLMQSTREAVADARAWLVRRSGEGEEESEQGRNEAGRKEKANREQAGKEQASGEQARNEAEEAGKG